MTHTEVTLTVNAAPRSMSVDRRTLLVDALRDELGLPGTHVGCNQGVCGTCTVLVDGRSVRACLMLAVQAEGHRVETVESINEPGGMSTLQQALSDCGGVQCGYCTPGMLMRATELLRANPTPDREQIREAVSSNLCRCTGYTFIVDGIEKAAERLVSGETTGGTGAPS